MMTVGLAPWLAAGAQSYVEFFRAIDVDNERAVIELLARGFDANTPDERGQHPLFLALRAESDKVTKALLEHAATEVDHANALGETPLMMAALRGREAWVLALIGRGARVNREGWTPLHYAASGPSLAVLKLLVERGAALDARAPNGSTPLMVGAQHGSEEAVVMLLERGADARLRDSRGRSASDLARHAGREGLAARIDPSAR
jgi:ankyrin repeat protein